MAGGADPWASAMAEVEDAQQRDAGLWAKCFAEADGEESRAKAAYIKTRVGQLSPRPTTGYCPNCNYELSLKAEACPNCKAIFDLGSSWAPIEKPQADVHPRKVTHWHETPVAAPTEGPTSPKKGGLWRWIIGVPVALFAAVMVLGSINADPDKLRDRRAYEFCLDSLASADRSRNGTGNFVAGACEKMRSDFVAKYGRNP